MSGFIPSEGLARPASLPAIIRDLTVALIYYSWRTSIELNVMEKFG